MLVSWLLPPILLRPFHLPPHGDYLLVPMLLAVQLFIWPLVTVMLIAARSLELLHGRGLVDLILCALPALIELQVLRLWIRGGVELRTVIGLHAAIAISWWAAWYGMLTTGLELQAGG